MKEIISNAFVEKMTKGFGSCHDGATWRSYANKKMHNLSLMCDIKYEY